MTILRCGFTMDALSSQILSIVRPMKSYKGANYGVGCTPLGTKVPIHHFKAGSMPNMIHNVVKLKTCAVSS